MNLDDILQLENGIFDFNLKCLYYVGLWPKFWPKKLIYYRIYEIVMYIIPIGFMVLTGIGTYQCRNNMIMLMSNLDKTFAAYNFFLKISFFIFKRKQLDILIREIQDSGDIVSKDRKRLMALHVIIVTVCALVTVGSFSLVSVFNGELPVEAWLPINIDKSFTNLLSGVQILAITLTVALFRNFSIQGIVCGIILYMCDQLVEIQKSLRNIEFSIENETLMRFQFKEIVKKHVRLMRYSDQFKNIFQEFFLVQNFAVTIELCLSAIMVSILRFTDKTLLTSFLAYLGLALLNAYIFCYLGNELILKSKGVAQAAYESEWTSWPIDLQKDLLILIRVAQKPFNLSAGGIATMCIETFSQAIYNAYSIFAVLSDIVE